jgi:hypothetical protein
MNKFLTEALANTTEALKQQVEEVNELGVNEWEPSTFMLMKTPTGQNFAVIHNADTQVHWLLSIGKLIIEHDAEAVFICSHGWQVEDADNVAGMDIRLNPRRKEVLQGVGVSKSGDSIFHDWEVSRADKMELISLPMEDDPSIAGPMIASVLKAIGADIPDRKLTQIGKGERMWPSMDKFKMPPKRNEPCDCQSGKKAKKCCHR